MTPFDWGVIGTITFTAIALLARRGRHQDQEPEKSELKQLPNWDSKERQHVRTRLERIK